MKTSSSSTSRFSCATGEGEDMPGKHLVVRVEGGEVEIMVEGGEVEVLPGFGGEVVTLQCRCGHATVCSVSKHHHLLSVS